MVHSDAIWDLCSTTYRGFDSATHTPSFLLKPWMFYFSHFLRWSVCPGLLCQWELLRCQNISRNRLKQSLEVSFFLDKRKFLQVYKFFYFRKPRRSMTHVVNIFTYKSDVHKSWPVYSLTRYVVSTVEHNGLQSQHSIYTGFVSIQLFQ